MKRDLKTWKLSMMAWVDGKTLCFDGLLSGRKQKKIMQGRYVLTVETVDVIRLSLKRRDGGKMKVDHVEYHFSAPLLNFSKIILPDTGRTYMEKDKAIYLRSAVTGVTAPNDGHPFIAVVDQAGDVSFSFGLLTSSRETTFVPKAPKISARKALLGGEEVFTIAARVPTAGWTMGSVAEVKEEVEFAQITRGASTVTHLDRLGVLDKNFLAVHTVWLTDEEIRIFAERDVKVSHNPASAMRVLGMAKVPEMIDAGVCVSIGTDGAPSNNRMSMVDEMWVTSLLQKVRLLDPTAMPAETVLGMATCEGARALMLGDQVGSLEEGKKADLVLINPNTAGMLPMHDPIANMITSMRGENIESVMVDGRWLMLEKELLTVNEPEILSVAIEQADALRRRAGIHLPDRFNRID